MKYIFLSFFLILDLFSSTLHFSISSSPSRLNPLLATDSASSEVADWIFNGLVSYDRDGKVICRLAKSYHFKDSKTLIFRLKQNIKWSDGKEFSGDDVLFTYNLITSPKIYTPYKDTFRYVSSVKKLDKFTIEVKYKKPYYKALHTWMSAIIPKHMFEGKDDIMTNSFNQKPVGTGPYTIDGFAISKDIKLYANKNYFLQRVNIDQITYHFIPDPATSFLMLKTKKLDLGSLTPLQLTRQIDDDFKNHYKIYEQPSNSYTYLGFNLKDKKFQNPKVREAINIAINKQELVDILFFGHGQVCNGPFMPKSFAYNKDIEFPKQDIKRAIKLLKEAGYDKKTPLSFTITTNSNNPTRVYATQILQHQLSRVNIKVTIRAMEWQAFLNTVVLPRKFEAVVLGWGLSLMPDPYSIWHSDGIKKGGFNFVSYKNNKVDSLIESSQESIDQEVLEKQFQEIFSLIVKDNPYIFLYIPNSITAVSKNIKNVSPSIIGITHNVIDWIKP